MANLSHAYMGSQLNCVDMKKYKILFGTFIQGKPFGISERFKTYQTIFWKGNACNKAYWVIIFEMNPHWAFSHLISRWFATLEFGTPFFEMIPIPHYANTLE